MIIFSLLRNKIKRIKSRKDIIFSTLLVIPVVFVAAFIINSSRNTKYNVAIVAQNNMSAPHDDKCVITVLKKDPGTADLALGRYDFTAVEKSDRHFTVNTVLKSKDEKQMIEKLLNEGKSIKDSSRTEGSKGVGKSILGIIVMLAIIGSTTLTVFYPDDISFRTLKRIFTTEATENQYIISQFILTFTGIYVPSFLAAVLAKAICGSAIGFSVSQIAVLIAIITALATAFALFISTVMKENIQVASCCIALITCLLGGCFFNFSSNMKIIDPLCRIIPVKSYMNIADVMENGGSMFSSQMDCINILVWTLVMFIGGICITKRKFKQGIYN